MLRSLRAEQQQPGAQGWHHVLQEVPPGRPLLGLSHAPRLVLLSAPHGALENDTMKHITDVD